MSTAAVATSQAQHRKTGRARPILSVAFIIAALLASAAGLRALDGQLHASAQASAARVGAEVAIRQ